MGSAFLHTSIICMVVLDQNWPCSGRSCAQPIEPHCSDGGYLLQARRISDRMQGSSRKPKDTDAGLGSRLALCGAPYRRAMTDHRCSG
jgi:hypothetical protein